MKQWDLIKNISNDRSIQCDKSESEQRDANTPLESVQCCSSEKKKLASIIVAYYKIDRIIFGQKSANDSGEITSGDAHAIHINANIAAIFKTDMGLQSN